MTYDQILDSLCDAINENDTQDALDAVLATLVLLLHKVPDRQLHLSGRQVERVYLECFGGVAAPWPTMVH